MRIGSNDISFKSRSLLALVALLIAALACQTVTGAFQPPSPVPTSTSTASPPASIGLPSETPGPTPDFNAAGVRYCYYVPGVSVPAQMPPDVLATPTPYVLPTPAIPAQTTVDTATTQRQLDLFQQLWQDVNDNYVYTDFNGHDWQAIGDK